jgi:hypothetical protein
MALAGAALLRPARPAHWVLVAPGLTGSAAPEIAPLLDSLTRGGATARLLAPGFPAARQGPDAGAAAASPDLWSLVRAADAELAAGSSVVVVTPPELALIRGSRPTLATGFTIRSIGRRPGDSAAVEAEWRRGDSVSQMVARRVGGGVRRTVFTRPAGPADSAVRRADSLAVRIVADSSRRDDARYVQAGFAAAAAGFGVPVTIETLAPVALMRARVGPRDWTAWLGGAPPDLPGAVLTDAGSRPPLQTHDIPAADSPVDPFGRPLLLRSGGDAVHTFPGRFNPHFGDFVLEPGFPRMIAQLWAAAALGVGAAPLPELRSVAPSQLAPARGSADRRNGQLLPLRNFLLALCAALFLAERWLAYRRR